VAQVVDIGCWWLARTGEPYGPLFATAIPITGGVVAAGLGLQIVMSLYDLFGRAGKVVVLVGLVAFLVGGVGFKMKVIDPYLSQEKVVAKEEG
jgi:hypothetical protein